MPETLPELPASILQEQTVAASPIHLSSPPLPSAPAQPTTPVASAATVVKSPNTGVTVTGSTSLSRKAGGVRGGRGPRPFPGSREEKLESEAEKEEVVVEKEDK
jgi:hypothetical protein